MQSTYTQNRDNPIYYEDYQHYSLEEKIQLGLQKPPHSLTQPSLYLSYSISLSSSHLLPQISLLELYPY